MIGEAGMILIWVSSGSACRKATFVYLLERHDAKQGF
jgi:hypothetical protein